jgi:rubredoxin
VSTTATPDTTDRPDAPDTKYGAVCPACDAPLDDVRDVLDGEPCPECGAHRSELYKLADQRGRGR